MSAFYSFRYPDRVQLLTDGGVFDENGVLCIVERKVLAFPGLPLVVTGRGTPANRVFEIIRNMAKFVDSFMAFDDIDPVIELLRSFIRELGAEHGTFDAEFLIAGYSARLGACHFIVPCHDHWGIEPFELASPGAQIAAGPAISMNDLAHLNLTSDDIADPDFPRRHGMEIMGAMRRKRARIPGSDREIYGVGGFCDLATVSAQGAAIETLGR
jgi:hypothetical protein